MTKNNKEVIYDSMNTQVWFEGDKSTGRKKTAKEVFGKNYKKFKSNVQARAYAIRLGKKLNVPVYDRYYGENLTRKQKVKNKLSSNTYQNQLNNMLSKW